MLARTTYPAAYVEAVNARVSRVLKAFDRAKPAEPFASEALLDVVIGLEMAFVHRLRANEGKDGNPLNEVRMITNVGSGARWRAGGRQVHHLEARRLRHRPQDR